MAEQEIKVEYSMGKAFEELFAIFEELLTQMEYNLNAEEWAELGHS